MVRYTLKRIYNTLEGKLPFWMPWGLKRWGLKTVAFICLLLTFLILFMLPSRCNRRQNGQITPPDSTTFVTPQGDTLRGYAPDLFNPENERGRAENPGGNVVPWPRNVDESDRHPSLPGPDDNVLPPTDPEQVITDPRTGQQIDGTHLLVVLNSEADDSTFNHFAEELSSLYPEEVCSIVYYNTYTKLLVLEVEANQREEIKNSLNEKIPDIDFYVVEVEVLESSDHNRPDDPAFRSNDMTWHFSPIQAYQAWESTTGSSSVTVAVVDSYFELNHPDLRGVNVVHPVSIENGTDNVYPPMGVEFGSLVHGTHVAGIIFGRMGNREGSCGIAPGCSFMPVSLGENLSNISVIEGVLYAVYKGADVVNISIGSCPDPEVASRLTLEEQVEIARNTKLDLEMLWDYVFTICEQKNVTLVWAAGNSNVLSSIDCSKRDSTIVVVDAVNQNLSKADFSNFGNVPAYGLSTSTVSAPGVKILSTVPFGDYMPLDGTSMAAPIVTGAVALMKSVCPTLTNHQVIEILKSTAKPLSNPSIGGLLQIADALEAVEKDFMRFDDVMSDHSKLLGKWAATRILSVHGSDDEKVELYLTFTSDSTAVKEIRIVEGERAPVSCFCEVNVAYGSDRILLSDSEHSKNEDNTVTFTRSDFDCMPDDDGFLRVTYRQESLEDVYFNLRKMNE